MSSTGAKCNFNMKKFLSLSQDFDNWRKNVIMVFKLMVSLYIKVCSNFISFNIWVAMAVLQSF